jgi:anti-sigma regulatory factor (Ser/Thr protein kinase)
VAAFAATLVQGPVKLRGMRHLLVSWLEATGASEAVRGAVMLATHEAAANAMEHGQPESPVTVTASQGDDGGFIVEVTSHGGWREPEPGHTGRGLTMMRELMSEVTIQPRTSVRMRSG